MIQSMTNYVGARLDGQPEKLLSKMMHANILRLFTWTSYIKFSMLVTFDISICG